MRGFIPEYEKLPKLVRQSPAPSPKRMEEELLAASAGLPMLPEFL